MTTAPVDAEGIETVAVRGDEVEFMGKRGIPLRRSVGIFFFFFFDLFHL